MKKLLSVLLTISLLLTSTVLFTATVSATELEIWDGTVANSFAGGTGVESDPYIIETADQLAYLANSTSTFSNIYIKLANDIYLNDTSSWEDWANKPPKNMWTPIGESSGSFNGVFDGGNNTIYGVYAVGDDYEGLVYKGGTIKNVTLKDSYIEATRYAGGISAYDSHVINCHNFATVCSTTYYAGGICGYSTTGDIEYCSNSGTVYGDSGSGGICGYISATIKYCYNTGKISSKNFEYGSAGGIAGRYNFTSLSELKRYSYYISGQLLNCYNCGDVSAWCAGGLLGNYSSFYSSHVGAASYYNYNSSLNTCKYYIDNCYSAGSVSGKKYTGEIIGQFPLVGETEPFSFNIFIASVRNVYYCGSSSEQLAYGNYEKDYAIALSETEAKLQSNYKFDFLEIWTMDGNAAYLYPKLINNYQNHEHLYIMTETDATCTQDGKKTYTCHCGDGYTEVIHATGHNFVDGKCSECEAQTDKSSSIQSVTYIQQEDTHKTFTVTCNNRAQMIQFIEPDGGTRTYDRYNKNVLIKSYNAEGKEVISMSRELSYEVWEIYTNLSVGTTVKLRAKFASVWEADKRTLFVEEYNPVVSMGLESYSGKKGAVPATVVADEKTEKVMFKMPNNTSVTVSTFITDENDNRFFTGKAWMNEDGLNEIKVYIRRNNVWKIVGTLEYTVE